jgi:transmembrane sensor
LNPLSKGSPRETTRVEAGQSAAGDAEGIQSLLSAKGNRLDRWRDGRIVYDDVPLGEVVSDLDRYIPGTLALADEDLAMLEVSAVLHLPDGTDADPNDLLDALTTSLDLSWSEVPGELKLISRK